MPQRRCGVGQRKSGADVGPDHPRREHLRQLPHVACGVVRPVAHERANLHAADHDSLQQDQIQRNGRDRAGGVAEGDERPAAGKSAQCRFSIGSPDRVEHHPRGVAGELADTGLQVLPVVIDRRLRAALPAQLELLRTRRGGQHPGLHGHRQIDCRQAHASRGAEDDHPIARFDSGDRSQRVIGRAVGDAERRRGHEVDVVGYLGDHRRVQQCLLGERPDECGGRNPLARAERHALTDRDDLAGELAARGERHRGLDLILALDHQHVGEVDRRRVHPHHQLPRSRHRIGDLVDDEVFRRSVGAADQRRASAAPPVRADRTAPNDRRRQGRGAARNPGSAAWPTPCNGTRRRRRGGASLLPSAAIGSISRSRIGRMIASSAARQSVVAETWPAAARLMLIRCGSATCASAPSIQRRT